VGELNSDAQIEVSVDPGGVATVAVSGDVDIANADALKAAVQSVTARRPQRLIFDLGELRFIDSAGLAVLLYATECGAPVELLNASAAVCRLVELTGLAGLLKIE
jgi:anti-sigma B factor antagonist